MVSGLNKRPLIRVSSCGAVASIALRALDERTIESLIIALEVRNLVN